MRGKPQDARHRGASWAGPGRLLDQDGQVPAGIATLIRSVGVRDAALAAALLLAPPGPAAVESVAQLADRRP